MYSMYAMYYLYYPALEPRESRGTGVDPPAAVDL